MLARRHTQLVLLMLFLAATGVSAQPTEHALPAEPHEKIAIPLQEVWRRGGEDDEELLLGVISRAVMDRDGRTYLLDTQLCEVVVIALDGQLVGTLGRQGEGPGEFQRPSDLFLMEEGRVAVNQGFPGKIVILNADDTPAGTIAMGDAAGEGGFFFVRGADLRAGNLVVLSGRGTFDRAAGKSSSLSTLCLVDREGRELVRFAEFVQERDFQRPSFDERKNFSELNSWALGDGILYTHAARDEYLIHGYDMTGELATIIRRDFTTRTRTAEERDEVGPSVRMRMRGRQVEVERHILDTDPAIQQLRVGPDGALYVSSCYARRSLLADGVARLVDVISPGAERLTELRLLVDGFDREQDRLMFLDGKHWLLIRNYDSAEEAMVAGFGAGRDGAGEEEDLGEAEPLELVLYAIPD